MKTYNQIAGRKVQRIEAVADGVFAIAMTLLVLELHVPVSDAVTDESDLIQKFCELTPKFFIYFLSFLTLGIFWGGHSAQYGFIEKSDRHLNWLSLFFLLFVSLIPFTTAFLGEYIHFKFAVFIYWSNIFLLGASIFFHWRYAVKNNYINGEGGEKKNIVGVVYKRIIYAQSLYFGSMLLCFINTYLSIAAIILIQMNYAFAFFFKPNKK